MTANKLYLKEQFDSLINSFLFNLHIPESCLKEYKKYTNMMINGYRLNHIKCNLNKPLEQVDIKYIIKCCNELSV